MRTIRRLYLYGVAIISLLVVTWGLIGLARSAFAGDSVGGEVTRLAGALALIFVGVPVFLLHWWLAQRGARDNEDEKFSRVRAIFLYGGLLATLMPVVQNILAIINRIIFQLFEIALNRVIFGYGQSWGDNLIAIVMNALIATYLFSVLRQNWDEDNVNDAFRETRRLYRLVWMLYGLLLATIGLQQILLYLFDLLVDAVSTSGRMLANGLTMVIVGTPLWVYSWRILQKAFVQEDEQRSFLRSLVLYGTRLIALLVTLSALGALLDELLRTLFGEARSFSLFMDAIREPLSIAIPVGIVWVYFSRVLRTENQTFAEDPQRMGLQRLSSYLVALIGLITVFVGFHRIIFTLIDLLPLDDFAERDPVFWARLFRNNLAAALTMLSIGLPVWLANWIPVNRKAKRAGEEGDPIRRSLIRRGYLYLIMFGGVIGVMVGAGVLIFHLLQAILGEPDRDFVRLVLELISSLLLFGLLLWYHGRLVLADGRLAAETLSARHAAFPVLILVSEIGTFSERMVAALQKEAPNLPVAVHVVDQGVPDEALSNAEAVILPAHIAAYPLEAIRLWVQNFSGVRFVIPTPVRGWIWVSGNGSQLSKLIRQAAEMVRKLADGETIDKTSTSTRMIVGYVFGGIFGLFALLLLFSFLMEVLV